MYIQAIEIWVKERNKHHFNRLLEALWRLGFTIKVPNPIPLMFKILKRKEFEEIDEQIEEKEEQGSTPELQIVMVKVPPP